MATETSTNETFVWHELCTTDEDACRRFYSQLFGWQARQMDLGAGRSYTVFQDGGKDVAGLYRMDPSHKSTGLPCHWMAYVAVADVDASAQRVESLGGKVLVAPSDIPGIGRFAVIADPSEATLALYKPSEG